MARPQKVGLDYFPHDVDASNDEKIEAMETLFGISGYAFYFKMAERIYRAGGELDLSEDVTRETLSKKLFCTREDFEKMLSSALNLKLFDKKYFEKKNALTSDGIKKRCGKILTNRDVSRKSKACNDLGDGVFHKENIRKTSGEPPKFDDSLELPFREIKEKEIKEKERKEKEIKKEQERAHDPENWIPASNKNLQREKFDEARKIYPGTKGGLTAEWVGFSKKYQNEIEIILPKLIPAIEAEKQHKSKLREIPGAHCPAWKNFQTWINNRCWEQELGEVPPANSNNFKSLPASREILERNMQMAFGGQGVQIEH